MVQRNWLQRSSLSGIVITGGCCLWIFHRYEEQRRISESEREKCRNALYKLASLDRAGVTVVQDVLQKNEQQFWKHIVREAAVSDQAVNVNGRLHYHVSRTHPRHAELAAIGGEVWQNGKRVHDENTEMTPLIQMVRKYFRDRGVRNYRLTQLQFLTAVPDSDHQIWHRDNVQPGLTAIIALTDITHGATELVLCSHQTSIAELAWTFVQQSLGRTALPAVGTTMGVYLYAGDAILYDARVLHRGRGFTAHDYIGDRPVLVIRWDADLTPPPGAGMIRTAWHRYAGIIIGWCAPRL